LGEVIRIIKKKIALKDKKFRTQIIGKLNDIGCADENKITAEAIFKNYKKTIHLFIDRRLRSCTCF
jgi:hypothetical protein